MAAPSTALTLFANNAGLPAHLAQLDDHANILPRDTTPALTFRGKTWRLRQGGEEIVLERKNAEGELEPAPTVQVVVLNVNQKRSRTFYEGAYVEGQNKSPFCWSSDGDKPDKDVPAPCAATCASCKNSVKGSKITANNKETTACSTVKRLAVIPAKQLDMEPMLLKVPQTSMWDKNNEEAAAAGYFAWDQYVDFLRQRNVKHTCAVVTKIKFDKTVAYPKLLFTAARWIEAEDLAKIVPLIDSDAVKKLLSGKIVESLGTDGEEAAPPAPAPVAEPAKPPKPPKAATPPPAPAPAPAAAVQDDDDGDFVPPAKATPAPPAAAAPAAAAKPAPAPPKPPVPPPVATAPANSELAALAAAWDD
jgi:hypothetical protein